MGKSNRDIAHDWAHKAKEKGTGSNFFYEGDTIYSYGYHFPIATHYKGVVLFTTRDYSNTTSTHKNHVEMACSHLDVIYAKDFPYKGHKLTPDHHKDNLETMVKRLHDFIGRMKRSRKHTHLWQSDAELEVKNIKRYYNLFEKEIDKRRLTKELKKIISSSDVNDAMGVSEEFQKEISEKLKEQRKRERKRLKKEAKKKLRWWMGFRLDQIPKTLIDELSSDHLRSTGKNVQTTQGVTISIDEAKRVYEIVKLFRNNEKKVRPDVTVDNRFKIDSISTKGISIGCHFFKWNVIDDFAKHKGWV